MTLSRCSSAPHGTATAVEAVYQFFQSCTGLDYGLDECARLLVKARGGNLLSLRDEPHFTFNDLIAVISVVATERFPDAGGWRTDCVFVFTLTYVL